MSAFDGNENDRRTWEAVKKNIIWSMTSDEADTTGRGKMVQAVGQKSLKFMGGFKDGFNETQSHQESTGVLSQFNYCCQINEAEVYNFGRSVLGYPPI